LLKDAALSAAVEEQIGIVVSGINPRSQCIAAHLE
jgi:AhpD family alkylhydroperoxidase